MEKPRHKIKLKEDQIIEACKFLDEKWSPKFNGFSTRGRTALSSLGYEVLLLFQPSIPWLKMLSWVDPTGFISGKPEQSWPDPIKLVSYEEEPPTTW